MHQIQSFPGLCRDPTRKIYSASQTPSCGARGSLPYPKNPSPIHGPSGLERASSIGPLCLECQPYGPHTQHTHILFQGAVYVTNVIPCQLV